MGDSSVYGIVDAALAAHLFAIRNKRGLSLDQAAAASGVSRATLSRIARGETSPTAHVHGRLSAAYGLTLSVLLAAIEEDPPRILPRNDAARWKDPDSGNERWTISPPASGYAIELVWAEPPSGIRIEDPTPAYPGVEEHIVLFASKLRFEMQDAAYHLHQHDSLRLKLFSRSALESCGSGSARRLISTRGPS